ncbi:MAG: hypothetical protein BMS9Abin36_0767 [Gammaproteobacteria bacterium]|nr:MAG: hypothetical protein BMS9Abin36_0767 [Gammaproteobacteria bacterium]
MKYSGRALGFSLGLFCVVSLASESLTEQRVMALANLALADRCARYVGCSYKATKHEKEWIVIGSYIIAYENHKPLYRPGGWSAVHISLDGKVDKIVSGY